MGQLELEPRIVILEKMGGVVDTKELDKSNPPSALVVSQPNYFDVFGVENLGVRGDAREAVEEVILGRVVGQSLDDDGGRRTAGRLSAGGARARAGATVTLSIVGQLVVVGKRVVVLWS